LQWCRVPPDTTHNSTTPQHTTAATHIVHYLNPKYIAMNTITKTLALAAVRASFLGNAYLPSGLLAVCLWLVACGFCFKSCCTVRLLTKICVTCTSSVGGASACEEDCAAATSKFTQGLIGTCSGGDGTTCPAGCQDEIDAYYTGCGGCGAWDDANGAIKTQVEALGCGGAAQTAPALFVALAAVANHFFQ
jgi:hypothetical protein